MGKFVWYDLMTSDADAAELFYHRVMGWTMSDSGLTDRRYTMLSNGPVPVGGLMPVPDGMTTRSPQPCWSGYIGVANTDGYCERIVKANGEVYRGPQDISNVGRFAVVADPFGAVFILFTPIDPDVDPRRPPRGTPGHIGWHELVTADGEAAFAFYHDFFDWRKGEAVDMGPMGVYQMFVTDGDEPVGGIFTQRLAAPHWRYYFNVASVAAAVERVRENGGQIVNGPLQVPGGGWTAQCIDPQGAFFALTGPQ